MNVDRFIFRVVLVMKKWLCIVIFGIVNGNCCMIPDPLDIQEIQHCANLEEDPVYEASVCCGSRLGFNHHAQERIFEKYKLNVIFFRNLLQHIKKPWSFIINLQATPMDAIYNFDCFEIRVECLRSFRQWRFVELSSEQLRFIIECAIVLNCRKLNLSYQYIKGFSGNMQNFTKLTKLVLYECNIDDAVVGWEYLCALPNLKEIDLKFNNLTVVPEALGNIPGLEKLDLRGNPIKKFPRTIGRLVRFNDGIYALN